jgi:hypothetical protein
MTLCVPGSESSSALPPLPRHSNPCTLARRLMSSRHGWSLGTPQLPCVVQQLDEDMKKVLNIGMNMTCDGARLVT